MPEYRPMGRVGKKSARRVEEESGTLGDLLSASEGSINATLMLVLATRGAIFFGMPRNGSAVLIRAWIGGEQYEDYCASSAEVQATLEALRDAAEAALMR
jgi:hypothetical protein